MSLQQAVDDSGPQLQTPYKNEDIYPKETLKVAAKKIEKENEDDDDDDADNSSTEGKPNDERQAPSCTEDLSLDELIKFGGKILMLHDEILHQVFAWLPVDAYAIPSLAAAAATTTTSITTAAMMTTTTMMMIYTIRRHHMCFHTGTESS